MKQRRVQALFCSHRKNHSYYENKHPNNARRAGAAGALNPQLSTLNRLAQGTTAFTYQGRLNAGANAANGSYDMTFAVYDANVPALG